MKTIYLVIEMADVELVSVKSFAHLNDADANFQNKLDENREHEWDACDLKRETRGTLRMAGDDSYSVQLIESELN